MATVLRATRAVDFDGLYRRHAASVYRYTRAVLGNHADAEDVTQQTFLNAYRAMAQGTKPRKAENWLLRIAHNEVRKHFRSVHQKMEVELDEQLPERTPERSGPSLADVLRALQHLPPTQRSALVMREFEGRSYAEIAEIMDITQSALEAQIFRARRGLAEQLQGELTCAEAEQALLRRLDGRLPRRVARRLKSHLRECSVCERFGEVQRRQRGLLKGLSVMPVPASVFLFRSEQAAAGVGMGAVASGGSAAVGGAAATAAGAGGTGFAGGVIAKVAAVAAAASVAGGVGYGVAAGPEKPVKADRAVTGPAAVAPPGRAAEPVRFTESTRPLASAASVATPQERTKAKTPARSRESRGKRVGQSENAHAGLKPARGPTAVDKPRPKARPVKTEPKSRPPRPRPQSAAARNAAPSKKSGPKRPRPARVPEKPKVSPPAERPPKAAEEPRPKKSAPTDGD